MARSHFSQEVGRQYIPGHKAVQEAYRITWSSNQKPMVDPPRIIPGAITPCGTGKVFNARRQPHRVKFESVENQIPQGAADISTDGPLDELANKQIPNVGIAPAMPRIEIKALSRNAVEQLADLPRLLTAPNSFMIGCKIAIVWNASTMLKQLAQRKRAIIDRLIEMEIASSDQLKGRRGQRRLGEAPPWNACVIGADA
jgi:hypothetical protein